MYLAGVSVRHRLMAKKQVCMIVGLQVRFIVLARTRRSTWSLKRRNTAALCCARPPPSAAQDRRPLLRKTERHVIAVSNAMTAREAIAPQRTKAVKITRQFIFEGK
jgi:hypothetical protein